MSSTVEALDQVITEKLEYLKKLIQITKKVSDEYDLPLQIQADVSRIADNFEELENNYKLGSVSILSDYFNLSNVSDKENNERRKMLYQFYIKFVNKENVLEILERLYIKCKKILALAEFDISNKEYKNTIEGFEKDIVNIKLEEKLESTCPSCGFDLVINGKTSEKLCTNNNCGYMEYVYGTVVEDDQGSGQESCKKKKSRYDPAKHCKYWLNCIHGEEKINEDKLRAVVHKLVNRLRQDGQIPGTMTCEMYRCYLKEIGETKFNDHIPRIRKEISGIEPKRLTENEKKMVPILFRNIVRIFNKIMPHIKEVDKPNCPYHPYFIYKIIENLLSDPSNKKRKEEILSCIHLQGRETMIENDKTMEAISIYIPGFKYTPTIKDY